MNSHGIFDSYPAPTPSMLTSIYCIANKLHFIQLGCFGIDNQDHFSKRGLYLGNNGSLVIVLSQYIPQDLHQLSIHVYVTGSDNFL